MSIGPMSVLVAEDEETMQTLLLYQLQRLLPKQDIFLHKLWLCGDGSDVKRFANTAPEVSLIIMDRFLGSDDGLSLIKFLRTIPQYRETPAVVFTSLGPVEIRALAKEYGDDKTFFIGKDSIVALAELMLTITTANQVACPV